MIGAKALFGSGTALQNVSFFTNTFDVQTNSTNLAVSVQGYAVGFYIDYIPNNNGAIFIPDYPRNQIYTIVTNLNRKNGLGFYNGSATMGAGNVVDEHNGPIACVMDYSNNLYIAESKNNNIRKFALCYDYNYSKTNTLFTASLINNFYIKIQQILAYVGSGSVGYRNNSGGAFSNPSYIAVDSNNNLYITDDNSVIRKVNSKGVVTTLAGPSALSLGTVLDATYTGTTDASGSNARFKNPRGIAVDLDDNIYVADTGNHTIRKISLDGVVTTIAGTAGVAGFLNGVGTNSRFSAPLGICCDFDGNIFVADALNFRIRKITKTTITTPNVYGKLGKDITGEATGDYFGRSVAMNAAGDRVVIGSADNDGNGVAAGSVRVYSWNGTNWYKLGQDLDGEATGDASGYAVSMNSSGDRIVIGMPLNDGNGSNSGAVRVYSWNGTTWTQIGVDINGEASTNRFGNSVSMNAVGDRIAVGANLNNGNGTYSGSVRVYYRDVINNSWVLLGQEIDGERAGDQAGWSVSINSAGDRVAIGAVNNDNGGVDAGSVRIYSYDGANWTQIGQDIDGGAIGDAAGWAVSMNSSGDKVIIGIPRNDENGVDSGLVRIYSYDGTLWNKLGQDIKAGLAGDSYGSSVDINASGDKVIIGNPRNDANGSNSGAVRIYSWNGNNWVQVGDEIIGEFAEDGLGASVSMNASGNRIAIGAYSNGSVLPNAGAVRVYEYNSSQDIYTVSTLAGAGTSADTEGDYLAVQFAYPRDVKMMHSGDLLVSDGAVGYPSYKLKRIKNTTNYKTTFNIVLSSDIHNLYLDKYLLRRGWDGVSPVDCTLTILSGVSIYNNKYTPTNGFGASLTTNAALIIGKNLNTSTITIVNSGYIVGAGGNAAYSNISNVQKSLDGTDAMYIRSNITLKNYGVIGGGGGGGGFWFLANGTAGGGGGGAGLSVGVGKYGIAPFVTYGGQNGTILSGGKGTSVSYYNGNYNPTRVYTLVGGDGGDLGEDGKLGTAKMTRDNGVTYTTFTVFNGSNPNGEGNGYYTGGVAGNAIDGISFITIDPSSTGSIRGATIN